MNILKFTLSNFRFVSILIILLLLNGLYAYFSMPRYEDPQVPSSGARIWVVYPGANALEVEAQVIKPIEETLQGITGFKNVLASAQNDYGNIFIDYDYRVNRDEKYAEIAREIDNVRQNLPDGVRELMIEPINISKKVKIIQLALASDEVPFDVLNEEAEKLKRRVELIPGVSTVEIKGIPDKQVEVSVDLPRLAGLRIPLTRVLGAIQSSNTFIPAGSKDIGTRKFNIYTNSKYQSLDDIRNTVVHSADGKIIYLKDVASVNWSYEKQIYRARYNGKRAVFVTAEQKPGSNITTINDRLLPVVNHFKESLRGDIELALVFNQYKEVEFRINRFFANLVQGVILVGVIIFIFIGFRPSVAVMVAVPVSMLIGLGLIDFTGFGLQQMSIVGMVIALGLLVDNAIVVVENIVRFMELGDNLKDATLKGASQVAAPLLSSTLTTVLAFVPLVFIYDPSGDFIRSMPVSVIFTLSASLLVAVTLTPILSERMFTKKQVERKRFVQRKLENFIHSTYRHVLDFVLRKSFLTLLITTLLFAGSVALFIHVGLGFFPKAEKPMMLVNINLPLGSNINATDSIAKVAEGIIEQKEYVKSYTTNIGAGNPRIYYNMYSPFRDSRTAQILLQVDSRDPYEISQFRDDLDSSLSGIYAGKVDVLEFEQGPVFKGAFVYRIYGEDIDKLREISFELDSIVAAHPATTNVDNTFKVSQTDLEVHIDKDKAAMLGVGQDEINRAIKTGISGIPISTFNDKTGASHNIMVQLSSKGQLAMSDFDRIYVESMTGAIIPLKQLADIRFKNAPVQIQHFNNQRVVTLSADLKKHYNLNKIAPEITQLMDNYPWPEGYGYKIGGIAKEQSGTFASLGRAAIIALICIFAVLVLQFKSFVQPLIIFSAMPFAIIGSVLALYLTGNIFTFTALVGMTSLIGIVVNDSILLVDFANYERREGKSVLQAIKNAGEVRFIPIILTSLTTVGGLLPLTLGGGTLWEPMGWTIIGGLLTSTFLILLVVPVLYKLFSPEKISSQKTET